ERKGGGKEGFFRQREQRLGPKAGQAEGAEGPRRPEEGSRGGGRGARQGGREEPDGAGRDSDPDRRGEAAAGSVRLQLGHPGRRDTP
ncbi:unnamed protein product, partial [Ectocarpus sp. 12 AP-2014]